MASGFGKRKYVNKLEGSTVLVFGGTSGIGFCVAEAALEHGAHVIVSGSRQEKLDRAIERLQTAYPDLKNNVTGATCDLANEDKLERNLTALLEKVTKEGLSSPRKIDHIAYTAGDSLKITPVAESNPELIRTAGVVRFVAPIILAKVAPKYLNPGPNSSITFTGGTNTAKPMPGWAVIAGVGAGVEGLVRGLAVDMAPIRFNVVTPGAVHTELFDGLPNLDEALAAMTKATLTGKVGRPEDLAEAYVYLMKDRFITGTLLSSDGGRLLVS